MKPYHRQRRRQRRKNDQITALVFSLQIANETTQRLRSVLDAAREKINSHLSLPQPKRVFEVDEDYAYDQGALWMAEEILRALDGEPCPDCVDGIAPKDGNDGGTRYACPTCGGSGWWSDRQRCEGCGGTGRKG